MNKQFFSAIEREAIWIAYDKKCAYTSEPIEFDNFHIDHIIPQSIEDDEEKLLGLKSILGLEAEFDIAGYENLLPCKPGVNLKKSDSIFAINRAQYFLGIAKEKKEQIENNIIKIKKRHERGKAIYLLQTCLERGELSAKEILEIIDAHLEKPSEIFELVKGMEFIDDTEVYDISKDDIESLKNRPIKFGGGVFSEGLELSGGGNIIVKTCKEYESAIKAGHYPLTNFEIKMSVFFDQQSGLLNALTKAKLAQTSFIEKPHRGISDLDLLPFRLFPDYGGDVMKDEVLQDFTTSFQDKIDDGTLVVREIKNNFLRIDDNVANGLTLTEVIRADFNDDGIEEILLFEASYALHATMGFGGISIITRKGPNEMFEIVPIKD
jgi:hypothetical protein